MQPQPNLLLEKLQNISRNWRMRTLSILSQLIEKQKNWKQEMDWNRKFTRKLRGLKRVLSDQRRTTMNNLVDEYFMEMFSNWSRRICVEECIQDGLSCEDGTYTGTESPMIKNKKDCWHFRRRTSSQNRIRSQPTNHRRLALFYRKRRTRRAAIRNAQCRLEMISIQEFSVYFSHSWYSISSTRRKCKGSVAL